MAKFSKIFMFSTIALAFSCTVSAAPVQEDDVGIYYFSPVDYNDLLVDITSYDANTVWFGMLPELYVSENMPKQYGVTKINEYENYRKLQKLERWLYFCNHKC